jgi:Na+-translocating ferredoxin:NAD+ oxidoreductase subunit G
MKLPAHKPLALAIRLGLISLIGISLVSLVFQISKTKIADNQQAAVLQSLQQVLSATLYDNDLVNDHIEVVSPLLGNTGASTVYRARKHGKPSAVVIASAAPDGYNGKISLLVAIKQDGVLAGVRVVAHQETPGLGDKIESERSNWLVNFAQKSLVFPELSHWKVKRDGGYFDQFSGATITPRAVVGAVKNSLVYYQTHRNFLFSQPANHQTH